MLTHILLKMLRVLGTREGERGREGAQMGVIDLLCQSWFLTSFQSLSIVQMCPGSQIDATLHEGTRAALVGRSVDWYECSRAHSCEIVAPTVDVQPCCPQSRYKKTPISGYPGKCIRTPEFWSILSFVFLCSMVAFSVVYNKNCQLLQSSAPLVYSVIIVKVHVQQVSFSEWS